MNTGKTLFAQLMDFLPWTTFIRARGLVFDPLHYLSLLEQKTNALDQAAPLAGWLLPPVFGDLRRLLEARELLPRRCSSRHIGPEPKTAETVSQKTSRGSSTGMAAITGSGRFPAPSNTGPWPSPS